MTKQAVWNQQECRELEESGENYSVNSVKSLRNEIGCSINNHMYKLPDASFKLL